MEPIDSRILFEDNHLFIITKHAGELVQGDKTGDPCLIDVIKDFIKVRDDKPGNVYLGAPHRIDPSYERCCDLHQDQQSPESDE